KSTRSSVPSWMSARWAVFVGNPPSSSATRRASMKSGLELKIATRSGFRVSGISVSPREATSSVRDEPPETTLDLGPTNRCSIENGVLPLRGDLPQPPLQVSPLGLVAGQAQRAAIGVGRLAAAIQPA